MVCALVGDACVPMVGVVRHAALQTQDVMGSVETMALATSILECATATMATLGCIVTRIRRINVVTMQIAITMGRAWLASASAMLSGRAICAKLLWF